MLLLVTMSRSPLPSMSPTKDARPPALSRSGGPKSPSPWFLKMRALQKRPRAVSRAKSPLDPLDSLEPRGETSYPLTTHPKEARDESWYFVMPAHGYCNRLLDWWSGCIVAQVMLDGKPIGDTY